MITEYETQEEMDEAFEAFMELKYLLESKLEEKQTLLEELTEYE